MTTIAHAKCFTHRRSDEFKEVEEKIAQVAALQCKLQSAELFSTEALEMLPSECDNWRATSMLDVDEEEA